MSRIAIFTSTATLLLAACGGDQGAVTQPDGQAGGPARESGGPEHVHGLGVNPADRALLIATHNGLFRAPPGEAKATRVGTSEQDVMGFSVLGPNRFLGSGHPAPGQNLPPLLGLIESRDAGRTWQSISLMGQADFHVLRSAGRRVYGFNSATGALMVSADAGRGWTELRPPGPLLDLAIDPARATRVIASTDQALMLSDNAGRSWRSLKRGMIGLLAWPKRDQIYLIDAQGSAWVSTDQGRNWRLAGGTIGGQPAAFVSHGPDLYAALADGTVKRSSDRGATWSVRATP